MSTKHTIKYSEDFHFYTECFDDENVYLHVHDKNLIGINESGVTLTIPMHIWEGIKNSYHANTEYAPLSDEEIKQKVEKEVDDRIKEFENSNNSPLINLLGSFTYGLAEDPREQQIESGIKSLKGLRARQKALLEELKKIK